MFYFLSEGLRTVGLETVREAFKCARSDMTEKENKWYSSHWAFDLKSKEKTVSGE